MASSCERVTTERVRRDAECVIIRLGLGSYELRGPADNVLVPESRVAWATVVHDLGGEGYCFVTPEEFAETSGMTFRDTLHRIYGEGSLFAVEYEGEVAVPLADRKMVLPRIEV